MKVLKQRYYELTNKNLPIFGISTKSLKDFQTSERDWLRKITRMPHHEYRMWEEDIIKEERPASSGNGGGDGLDFEDSLGGYDDFVIIERLDMKKYNIIPKLEKEQKIKDSGTSQLLICKPGAVNNGKQLTLEDFKIKKVIDKGSFGKVFLVYNESSGKMYAMKRINKDILIDKN